MNVDLSRVQTGKHGFRKNIDPSFNLVPEVVPDFFWRGLMANYELCY